MAKASSSGVPGIFKITWSVKNARRSCLVPTWISRNRKVGGSVMTVMLRLTRSTADVPYGERKHSVANNYLLFSESIPAISVKEKKWIDAIPQGIEYADSVDYTEDTWEAAFRAALELCGIDVKDIDDRLDDFPCFDWSTEDGDWWIYTEESGDIEHVACVVQAFIRKFRPDFIFKLTWAQTCSKPRISNFAGGCLVVNREEKLFGNAYTQADAFAAQLSESHRV